MEKHSSCDGRVEHSCQNTTAISAQRYHVNVFIAYEFLNSDQQIAIRQNGMSDVLVRILFLEILIRASQTNLIPIVLAGGNIKQMNIEIVSFYQFHELIECHQIALVE